jgi:hypothetical protein
MVTGEGNEGNEGNALQAVSLGQLRARAGGRRRGRGEIKGT